MDTAGKIASHIGIPAIMTALGVKERVITHHIANGRFPASWYLKLCNLAGESLPHCAFKFQ